MKRNEGIHRHDISDGAWERIKELLSGQAGKRGSVADAHRRSVEGYTARIREPEQHT